MPPEPIKVHATTQFADSFLDAMSLDDLTLKAIVWVEDKEIKDNGIESLQTSGSNKTSPAIANFVIFLLDCCTKKGHNSRVGFDPMTSIEQMPFEGILLNHDESQDPDCHQRWWSDLIKRFLHHLTHGAIDLRCKNKKVLIQHEVATGCASTIKLHLIKRQF